MKKNIGIDVGLHIMNAFEGIKQIRSGTINACITSPPYYAVRDYGHLEQFGLEAHPKEYVDKLVDFMDEVYRVLTDDGILFLNLGDCYGGNRSGISPTNTRNSKGHVQRRVSKSTPWTQAKNLMMIPSRVAIGMQEKGWILRNKIIWHKPNALPSSVTDRWTNTYEEIFFFTKSPKYSFDLDKIVVPYKKENYEGKHCFGGANYVKYQGEKYSGKDFKPTRHGKNPGDVWSITTKPYFGPHPAVFPRELVEPMVKVLPSDSVVLDPFCGTGTVWKVTHAYHHHFVGFELNPTFAKEAHDRVSYTQMKMNI